MRVAPRNLLLAGAATLLLSGCGSLVKPGADAQLAIADARLLNDPAVRDTSAVAVPHPTSVDAFAPGTIGASVARALRDTPSVHEAVFSAASTAAQLGETATAFQPDIALQGTFGGTDYEGRTNVQRSGTVGPNVGVTLLDGGAREARIDFSRMKLVSSLHTISERVDAVALAVAEAHLDALRHAEIVEIARQNVAAHERFVAMVVRRIGEGQASEADRAQVLARLEAARIRLSEARAALADAQARYERWTDTQATGLSRPNPLAVPKTVSADLAATHPTVRAARAELQAALANLDIVDAERGGSLRLSLSSAGLTWATAAVDPLALGLAVIQASISLNDLGERGDQRLKSAAARVRVASLRLSDLERQVRLVAAQAHITWEAATEQRVLAERQSRNLATVGRLYLSRYEAGEQRLVEVLDAANEDLLGRTRAVTSAYAALFATYRFASASGDLADALGVVEREAVPSNKAAFETLVGQVARNR